MSIIKYRAFIKVVEQNSITKAAKELCYSQPAISRMIDSLEDDIGFALLNRNKDSITITENGKVILLSNCRRRRCFTSCCKFYKRTFERRY